MKNCISKVDLVELSSTKIYVKHLGACPKAFINFLIKIERENRFIKKKRYTVFFFQKVFSFLSYLKINLDYFFPPVFL